MPGWNKQESDQSEEQESRENQEGEPSDEQQDESEGEQAKQQAELSETWSEEDEQAMEQWLRRIPDDPGGLLRRKFRYQHQNRGSPEDESEPW